MAKGEHLTFAPGMLDDTPLKDVHELVMASLDEGVRCPCCTKLAMRYGRVLGSVMTRVLVTAYRIHGTEWFYMEKLCKKMKIRTGDATKVRFWGLIEKDESGDRSRPSGGSGWYRVTEAGGDFVDRKLTVPRKAHIFDNKLHFFSDDMTDVDVALGDHFDRDELMGGA